MSSAPSPGKVSVALRRRLEGRFLGGVADVAAPVRITGGFDFWVYGLHFGGPGLPAPWAVPLVARRLRLWMPLQFLHAWAAPVAREQGEDEAG